MWEDTSIFTNRKHVSFPPLPLQRVTRLFFFFLVCSGGLVVDSRGGFNLPLAPGAVNLLLKVCHRSSSSVSAGCGCVTYPNTSCSSEVEQIVLDPVHMEGLPHFPLLLTSIIHRSETLRISSSPASCSQQVTGSAQNPDRRQSQTFTGPPPTPPPVQCYQVRTFVMLCRDKKKIIK